MRHTPFPDSTLAFLRDGYLFGTRACRRLHTDTFATRLLGQPVVVTMGADAARYFYEGDRFDRTNSMPRSVSHLLQDEGSVQSLEGPDHRRRKELFLGLLGGEGERSLIDRFKRELGTVVQSGAGAGEVRSIDLFTRVLTTAVCTWAGLPAAVRAELERTQALAHMIEAAGSVGPSNWAARAERRRIERLLEDAVIAFRAAPAPAAPITPFEVVSLHGEPSPLPAPIVAVELLNILRPVVAVGRFMVFAAIALHRHPEWRERFAGGELGELRWFVDEVRRFYPFFPLIAGRASRTSWWRDREVRVGDRVLLDLYGTNHDPAIWPRAERFDPSRFAGISVDPNTLIPQGGGEYVDGHRCPGEPLTIRLLEEAVTQLTRTLRYSVPEQDLRISLRRFPALPESGLVLSGLRSAA
jgi:fatty-acid peroxygenase